EMRRGVALPVALNNGQQVDLLLGRIAGLYSDMPTFDSLPTPFRCVALDLRTSAPIVLDSGFLATAMRATMSLPGIFPPVETGSFVLVDGGPMNNVPADVVRDMGADVVIAVTVGSMMDTSRVSYSVFGLVNSTTSAMMRANTRRGMAAADIVVNPRVQEFGSLDWRRAAELERAGYRGADSMRAQLLPLAVDAATWRQYQAARAARRRTHMPRIAAVEIRGATEQDERLIKRRFEPMVGHPLEIHRVEKHINRFSGLDRYMAIDWDIVAAPNGGYILVITALPRRSAPPILMLGLNAQNQTSDEFALQVAARFLSFDVLMPGSELRVDGALGTNPRVGAELRDGLGGSMLFAAATVGAGTERLNFTNDGDAIIAQYTQSLGFGQLDVGLTPDQHTELRAGVQYGYYSARVKVGDPGLPSLNGPQSQLVARGIYDDQDSPVVPSEGLRVVGTARHVMSTPSIPQSFVTPRSNLGLTQAELAASYFWSWNEKVQRLFAVGGVGSSFGGLPLPTDQFVLGVPFRLDAFSLGERRGDYFAALTGGYLHTVGRLPDFLGGAIILGGWVETGSAFDLDEATQIDTQFGFGAILDTLLGPALVSYSLGSGERRLHVGFGRLWR
ncbi:MAG TPA: patatin-like phospholipase family protein, partial [Gemmatimonadaceae bacterium]|nr:patatin-like phospholipase family protein [Gemmatimonadaceae bacterium]